MLVNYFRQEQYIPEISFPFNEQYAMPKRITDKNIHKIFYNKIIGVVIKKWSK